MVSMTYSTFMTYLLLVIQRQKSLLYYFLFHCDSVAQKVWPGLDPSSPATSCAEIHSTRPTAPSGYYWLKSNNGPAISVYCDMSLTCQGVGGGWMQVVKLNITNSSQECPSNTELSRLAPIRVCELTTDTAGCSSSLFSVLGVGYNQVCGKIIGYQQGLTDAFSTLPNEASPTIDSNYVDGVSLTHGSNPREHIWTFAAARDEVGQFPNTICQCTNTSRSDLVTPAPSFVGNDYFCDTGSTNSAHLSSSLTFYQDDPLWDGAGCGPDNTCCSLNNPPWFLKQLPSSTTDDIEMRICRDGHQTDEKVNIEIVEIYVR